VRAFGLNYRVPCSDAFFQELIMLIHDDPPGQAFFTFFLLHPDLVPLCCHPRHHLYRHPAACSLLSLGSGSYDFMIRELVAHQATRKQFYVLHPVAAGVFLSLFIRIGWLLVSFKKKLFDDAYKPKELQ
jgi:hypothetical protein